MASEISADGHVLRAPLNITHSAPFLDLKGFNWTTVDHKLNGPTVALASQPKAEQAPLVAAPLPSQSFRVATTVPTPQPTVKLPDQLTEQLIPKDTPKPPEFPLAHFQGAWAGNGFNMIFRPRPKDDDTPGITTASVGPDDNILELNLTLEQLTFGAPIGGIPNRGLGDQSTIKLTGIPYLQTIQDVTDPDSGVANPARTDSIHFEPGMWLSVPPSRFHPGKFSVVRMASVPHGTTFNAQGFFPAKGDGPDISGVKGPPNFEKLDTTPFKLGKIAAKQDFFPSMKAEKRQTFRVPEKLDKCIEKGTITTAIIKNPHIVLQNAIADPIMKVLETITFEVSTGGPTSGGTTIAGATAADVAAAGAFPSCPMNGGGTSNISFLAGSQTPLNANTVPTPAERPVAHVDFMRAKYWIERVEYQVNIPSIPAGGKVSVSPSMGKSTAPTPQFDIFAPPQGVPNPRTIKVVGTQIQTSQWVNINFAPPPPTDAQTGVLTWPHVSVSTLVPKDPQRFQLLS